jgi:hypothetical protein
MAQGRDPREVEEADAGRPPGQKLMPCTDVSEDARGAQPRRFRLPTVLELQNPHLRVVVATCAVGGQLYGLGLTRRLDSGVIRASGETPRHAYP